MILAQRDGLSPDLDAGVYPPPAQFEASTGFDVMALRWPEVDRRTIDEVVARHPRENWLDTIPEFKAEGHPRTRARLLRRLGLFQFVRASPYRDRAGA